MRRCKVRLLPSRSPARPPRKDMLTGSRAGERDDTDFLNKDWRPDGNRTRVHGFAVRYVTTPPSGRAWAIAVP